MRKIFVLILMFAFSVVSVTYANREKSPPDVKNNIIYLHQGKVLTQDAVFSGNIELLSFDSYCNLAEPEIQFYRDILFCDVNYAYLKTNYPKIDVQTVLLYNYGNISLQSKRKPKNSLKLLIISHKKYRNRT